MRSSMLMVTCSAMAALIHGASAQAQTVERGGYVIVPQKVPGASQNCGWATRGAHIWYTDFRRDNSGSRNIARRS